MNNNVFSILVYIVSFILYYIIINNFLDDVVYF